MNRLSLKSIAPLIIRLLALALLAKAIAVALLWFLPAQSIALPPQENHITPYRHIRLNNICKSSAPSKQATLPQTQLEIHSLILHGLYGNAQHGYAIIATKNKPKKSHIIAVGERFEGYKLQAIALDYVVFEKGSKEYKLPLYKPKKSKATAQVESLQETADDMAPVQVDKTAINYYKSRPNAIWKDISIKELRKGAKIKGFVVTRIKKGAKIAQLGLKKGDILLKANGIDLNSYAAAMKLYSAIEKLNTLSLLIQRNGIQKEIIYEIH